MSNTPVSDANAGIPIGWDVIDGGAVRSDDERCTTTAEERRVVGQLLFDADVIPPVTGTFWTCRCGGDIGIKVNDRVVAHAFIFGTAPMLSAHVFDILRGGEPAILDLAEALTYMQQLAALHVREV